MAKIQSKVKVQNVRELLRKLKSDGFIVKNNKINEEFTEGDAIEITYPERITIHVVE